MKNFHPRRDALTAEQVSAGRRMREEHGTSWYAIGRSLGCDPETIQRALDPQFAERKRAANAKRLATRHERRKRLTNLGAKKYAEPKAKRSERLTRAERHDSESNIDEASARRSAVRQDVAFVDAMTKAVRMERETCPIGVDTRPSTTDPKFVSSRGSGLLSINGSPAQMCADVA